MKGGRKKERKNKSWEGLYESGKVFQTPLKMRSKRSLIFKRWPILFLSPSLLHTFFSPMVLCGKSNKPIHRKLVVVGDGSIGKSSILNVFTKGVFPEVRREFASLPLHQRNKTFQ
jgi:hypothetical protein